MREAGFEPAHPEIVGLKSTALDHSAIRANIVTYCHKLFWVFYFWFICILVPLYFGFGFYIKIGSEQTHPYPYPYLLPLLLRSAPMLYSTQLFKLFLRAAHAEPRSIEFNEYIRRMSENRNNNSAGSNTPSSVL